LKENSLDVGKVKTLVQRRPPGHRIRFSVCHLLYSIKTYCPVNKRKDENGTDQVKENFGLAKGILIIALYFSPYEVC